MSFYEIATLKTVIFGAAFPVPKITVFSVAIS